MALLTTQSIVRTGLTPSLGAVAASDTFTPTADTFIHIVNGGGSPDTATFSVVAGDPGVGLVIADLAVSVTNGQQRMIGPFPAQFFADPTTGLCTVAHSFTTSVTCSVLRLSQP